MNAFEWALDQVLNMTLEQGLVLGIALVIAGILVHQFFALEVDTWRDVRDQQLEAAQDQAIAIAAPLVIIDTLDEGQHWPNIPVQRVTNGEDLIGGDLR